MINVTREEIAKMLETKSVKQVAAELGVRYENFYYYCQSRSLNTSPKGKELKKKMDIDEMKMLELYAEGETLESIAKIFGVSKTTISKRMKLKAVKIRTSREAALLRGKQLTPIERKEIALAAQAVKHAKSIMEKFS